MPEHAGDAAHPHVEELRSVMSLRKPNHSVLHETFRRGSPRPWQHWLGLLSVTAALWEMPNSSTQCRL